MVYRYSWRNKYMNLLKRYFKKPYFGGALLIAAAMIANLLNFAFNAYLGRVLDLSNFALITLVGSIYTFASILFSAFGAVASYKVGFLIGESGQLAGESFLKFIQKASYFVAFTITALWLLCVPLLGNYFHLSNYFILAFFSPILLFGFAAAVNKGYLSATLRFTALAGVLIFEPIVKLLSAVFFVNSNLHNEVYLAVPFSLVGAYLLSVMFVPLIKKIKGRANAAKLKSFPFKYFFASSITGISTISFLSLDVILANHYLSSNAAGLYSLISLIGKVVYSMASLSIQFITPITSRHEGAKKATNAILYKILAATFVLAMVAFGVFGLFANEVVPFFFGNKTYAILTYLPSYLFAMMCFSLSRVFINYYEIKRKYIFSIAALLISVVQFLLISKMHSNIGAIVNAMEISGLLSIILISAMHFGHRVINTIEFNFFDFIALFLPIKTGIAKKNGINILIFNWRDIKHMWGGGAEIYIHELSKRWIDEGNSVTIFCGNDYANKKEEEIDGIKIIRRGGFYTMYVWAAIYYIFRLRKKFDLIIDSENGIPFFTPLFSRKPIFLLIFHVHQEVFLEHLKFPFSQIACFIEGKLMPFVYRNKQIITISESSKKEIKKLGFTSDSSIKVINPGIELSKFSKRKKTAYPSFVYVGRLKPYKNVNVAIKAFSRVKKIHPTAIFDIAGEGESLEHLKALAEQLGLKRNIIFHGKVDEKKKAELLSKSWAAIQPSMIEGWGITVIEANASGTPVIASNVNGLKDSIVDKKTGLLVKAKDVNEFAEAMLRTIGSTSFRTKIARNAFIWSKRFDWKVSAMLFINTISFAVYNQRQKSNASYIPRVTYEKN